MPTISIDTGSAATAIVAHIGCFAVAAVVVLNPETTATRSTLGADPAIGYPAVVQAEVDRIAAEFEDLARDWYGIGVVPVDVSPWLYAVEKINPARQPRNADEVRNFDPIDVAEGSTFAANAVTNWLLAVYRGRIVWVIPFRADTRWESQWEHGTGNPFDFYPAAFLTPVIPEGDTGQTYPDYFLDGKHLKGDQQREFRQTRVKDVCAAWSIGTDAAEDFARHCVRLYGKVLPPHLAPQAIASTCPTALNKTCGVPTVRQFDLGAPVNRDEARYQFARARLNRAVQGEQQDVQVLAGDLLVIAQYEGQSIGDLVERWTGWVTSHAASDGSLQFVQEVEKTALRLVA